MNEYNPPPSCIRISSEDGSAAHVGLAEAVSLRINVIHFLVYYNV
jgi:hypothetical protein